MTLYSAIIVLCNVIVFFRISCRGLGRRAILIGWTMLLAQCNLLTFGAARIDLATEVAVLHSASLNQSLMDCLELEKSNSL